MSGITLCTGKGCPLSGSCYRVWATPNEYRQAWFTQIPWDGDFQRCEYYIKATPINKADYPPPDSGFAKL